APGNAYARPGQRRGRRLETSIDLDAGDLKRVQAAARKHKVMVLLPVNERDPFSRGTLYNAFVLIGPDGKVLNHHRKLMPTNPERMVWGQGDARGLQVVETAAGGIGGLICWENYMPLA